MLRTKTECYSTLDQCLGKIVVNESEGWAVRQIVSHQLYYSFLVVFEREQEFKD